MAVPYSEPLALSDGKIGDAVVFCQDLSASGDDEPGSIPGSMTLKKGF